MVSGHMKRSFKIFALILLGAILCLASQIGMAIYSFHRIPFGSLRWPNTREMSEEDMHAWTKVQEAMANCDVKAVNNLLVVKPGEIKLFAAMCPLYPEGCTPVADISLKNVSNRKLVVLEPEVTRQTGASYESGGLWTDEFEVRCFIATDTRWCRVLAPGQVLALPPKPLEVEGTGKHRAHFKVVFPVYESITKQGSTESLPTVAETACTYELKGRRPAKVDHRVVSVVSTNGCITHVVERNQDAQSVAMMYGVDVKTLKKLNGLEGNDLRVGQELKIPEPE